LPSHFTAQQPVSPPTYGGGTKSFGEELSELLALALSVCPPLLSSSLALCDHELQSLSAKHHKVH